MAVQEVVICSVPHTGTNFCKRLFRDHGWEDLAYNEFTRGKPCYRAGHMVKETQIKRALELAETQPLIVPLRHPYRVEESWRRQDAPVDRMVEAFRNLMDVFVPVDPHIIPLDGNGKGEAIQRLSDVVGIELKDGGVAASKAHTYDMGWSEFNPSKEVIELVEYMQPLLSKYYGQEGRSSN